MEWINYISQLLDYLINYISHHLINYLINYIFNGVIRDCNWTPFCNVFKPGPPKKLPCCWLVSGLVDNFGFWVYDSSCPTQHLRQCVCIIDVCPFLANKNGCAKVTQVVCSLRYIKMIWPYIYATDTSASSVTASCIAIATKLQPAYYW